MIANSVFGTIGEIGVAWSVLVLNGVVVLGLSVLVPNQQNDWSSGGKAFEDTGYNLTRV